VNTSDTGPPPDRSTTATASAGAGRTPARPVDPEPDRDDNPFRTSELVAAGDLDIGPGAPPVPVAVWRVADVDNRYGHTTAAGLTPRLAALLVGFYTGPGDTVVSVGHDPALAGATGAGGRRYVGVDDPDDLAGLLDVAGTVRLLVLPWPPQRRPTGSDPDAVTALFSSCRSVMARDGCTVVAVAAVPAYAVRADHRSGIAPAARRAGLSWSQHIITVTAPISGERVTWRAAPAHRAILRAAAHVKIHMHLLVFSPSHPAGPTWSAAGRRAPRGARSQPRRRGSGHPR
jgi:hypothetical protein